MVEIYDIMNITCQNLYHMPYQPSTYITPRAGGPWGDIGFSGVTTIVPFLYNHSIVKCLEIRLDHTQEQHVHFVDLKVSWMFQCIKVFNF
jgi:hypothetical protein